MDTEQQEFLQLINELHKTQDEGKIEHFFLKIVRCLMNRLCIKAGGNRYRIVECEVYYNDNARHQDPYLYASKNDKAAQHQRKRLHWYFHGAGVDLTIGDNESIMGGILIRGIQQIDHAGSAMSAPILKPLILYDELLNNTAIDVFASEKRLCLEASVRNGSCEIITTGRFGIDKNEQKRDPGYFAKKYRFIDKACLKTFRGREQIAKELFNNGMSLKEAMELSGRKEDFFK